LQAVNETIQGTFVTASESNAAQSLVQGKGSHKFIDKVHVVHKESEKRHWAEMENFGSKRIAVNERHYRENPRLLESGLWCEVTIGYNPVEEDDYTFFIEEIRPSRYRVLISTVTWPGERSLRMDGWIALDHRSQSLAANVA
jgi:ATP-dependent Lon protease